MYEYQYRGKAHQAFNVKELGGSVWNHFNRSAITPSGNDDGLWELVLLPANNLGDPVVIRSGLYDQQEAVDCQADFHESLCGFFGRW